MQLRNFLKDKNRKEFAEKIGTSIHYLNNLCQRPEQAGKKIVMKIQLASGGKVTFGDMWNIKMKKAG